MNAKPSMDRLSNSCSTTRAGLSQSLPDRSMYVNAVTKRRLVQILGFTLIVAIGWFTISLVTTIREIPEAYAAWDTGTLLTTYMDNNDGRWPSDWDDLATVINDGQPMLFSRSDSDGNPISNREYINKLRSMIRVDWSFDPVPGTTNSLSLDLMAAVFGRFGSAQTRMKW